MTRRPRPHQVVEMRALGPDEKVHDFARDYTLCGALKSTGDRSMVGSTTPLTCTGCIRETV